VITLQILLDTANLEDIKRLNDLYPIRGVTTNPTILARENTESWLDLLKNIDDILCSEQLLFAQVTASNCEDMIKEAEFLVENIRKDLYIKITVIPEGIKAIKKLNSMGINTTATAVFSTQQAVIAANAGADFIAPYVNRLDNIEADGVSVVRDIAEMFKIHNIESKIIAASFKNVNQVKKCCLAGADTATVSAELYEEAAAHPLTDAAVEQFKADWKNLYGDKFMYQY